MIEIGRRAKKQAPPPHVLFESLCTPDRDPARPWLNLLDDEVRPTVRPLVPDRELEWTSIWTKRPDAVVHFSLHHADGGTNVIWTLFVDDPAPEPQLTGHMRKRLNQLINAELRYSYGQ